jgi:anti-sigma regulatory factor (Ser/Thr protein kinase)
MPGDTSSHRFLTGTGLLEEVRRGLSVSPVGDLPHAEARALVTLAVQEIAANIWEHGYGGAAGKPLEIRVLRLEGDVLTVTVEDAAPVHDVTRAAPRSLKALATSRAPRGRGMALVRELAASVTHRERPEGGNRLTLVFDPALIVHVLEGRMHRAG